MERTSELVWVRFLVQEKIEGISLYYQRAPDKFDAASPKSAFSKSIVLHALAIGPELGKESGYYSDSYTRWRI
jgi:hypothetical protein